MKLTRKIFFQGRGNKNGWSKYQCSLFGVTGPLKKGWIGGIVGKDYPPETIKKFLAAADRVFVDKP